MLTFKFTMRNVLANKTRFRSVFLSVTGLTTLKVKMTFSRLKIHCFRAELGAPTSIVSEKQSENPGHPGQLQGSCIQTNFYMGDSYTDSM